MNEAGETVAAATQAADAPKHAPGFHRAFGLLIRSEVPLPDLAPAAAGEPDLDIVYATFPEPRPTQDDGVTFRFDGDVKYLAWPEVASFRIVRTHRIEVDPFPGTPVNYLPFPLLGPVMALLLHLRGLLVLHGSAVAVGGSSAMFVGDKMAGKSTTAAAFLRAGHRLMTDDLLAIDFDDAAGTARILPAFAQIKLSEEASARVVIDGAEKLPLVYADFEKHQHRIGGTFLHDTLAPDALYVLDRGGDVPAIERLTGMEALGAIMRFSYISRFGKAALDRVAEARHLRQCAALARQCTIARLHVPADLDRLDETVALIETAATKPTLT